MSENSRRDFLRNSVAAAAMASATPLLGTAGETQAVPSFEFDEATIASLQQHMKSGALTSRALVEAYLSRIGAVDKRTVNSVLELNPEAGQIADALDRERRDKGPRGPLHGIPVLIKDNIATADRMTTTAGSLALQGCIAPKDSFVAAQLRRAGAVILGKTNLSEWANIRSSQSTSGWSGRGGLTRNPYALDRNPSGSSSGSAVAAAANFCAAAVGTETDGSVVSPSSKCSLVGIKPTVGLVSRFGIVPISHTQDTAGPMARTVADAATLLTALAGYDPADVATEPLRSKPPLDYTHSLDPNGLRGVRIGVVRKYFGSGEAVDRLVNDVIAPMKANGVELIDPVEIENLDKMRQAEFDVLLYELKADLNDYLKWLGGRAQVHSLADVIDFNEKHRREEMPWFGQNVFVKAQNKGPLTDPAYLKARDGNHKMAREQGIDAVMDKFKLDALLAPTGPAPWMTDLVNGDHAGGESSGLAAIAGYPSITVPAGFVFGLPVGISFFGRAWSEPTLIKIAYSFEQLTKARRPPTFAPTADLRL